MAKTFTAVVFPEPNRAELREFPIASPGPGEVQVRVTTSGVSMGTEYLVLCGQFPNQKFPCLTGYQSVGVVEELGADVTNLRIGDRVFVGEGTLPDGYADGAGVAHVSRANIPAASASEFFPRPLMVPPHVTDASASYLVLVAVALEGAEMANIRRGDLVAVVGLGVVGQLCAQVARARGANVVASDLDNNRVAIANRLGITAFASDVDDFDAEIRKRQEKGADVVFETTGNTRVLERALTLARNYGTFVVQGHYPGSLEYRFTNAHWRHLTMVFPCGGASRWDAMHALDRGLVAVEPLITQRIRANEAPELYARLAQRDPALLGAIIDWV